MPSTGFVATSGRSWPNTRSSSGTHLSPLGQTWGRGSAPRSLRPLAPRVAFETLTPAERGLASRRTEDGHVPGGEGDARAALDDRHEDARCVQVSLVPGHATPVRCGPRRGERFRRRALGVPSSRLGPVYAGSKPAVNRRRRCRRISPVDADGVPDSRRGASPAGRATGSRDARPQPGAYPMRRKESAWLTTEVLPTWAAGRSSCRASTSRRSS